MPDIRYAFRMLRRTPGFTAITILLLALGIGANTAIFSLINTLLLRPLPVRNPGELVQFVSQYPDPTEPPSNSYAWKYYERFRRETDAFSDLIAISPARFRLRGDGIDADAVEGEYVGGNFFTMLGVTPAAGRLVTPQDDTSGSGSAVAVLSWASWTNRFHADPTIVGRQVALDGVPATVVGVAPRGFFGVQVGAAPEIWVPVAVETQIQHPSRRASGELSVSILARLKPGVPLARARAELQPIGRDRNEEVARRGDARWRQVTIDAVPAAAGVSRLTFVFARPLFALMAIVGLLLLLACTSVATLLIARGAARQREMTVRVALGASRLRLMRQVLTESLLLAAAGCVPGIALAYAGAGALTRIVTSGRMPGLGHIELQPHLDLRVLLFTVAVSLLTGLMFGIAPALTASDAAPAASLRGAGAAPDTPSRRAIGNGLVVVQVALSIVLLATAALFVRHMVTLRNVGLGFERESLLLVSLDPPAGYQGSQLAPIYRELLERFAAIPGVRSATVSGTTPVSGGGASRFIEVPGFRDRPGERRRASLNWIAPRFFETLGTPMLAGRDFGAQDQGGPLVAIVNEAMARYYFGDRSPVGQMFTFEAQDNRGAAQSQPYRIVGVVGDAKYLNLQEPIPRMVYLDTFQEPRLFSHQFSLRTSVRPESVVPEIRRAVRGVAPAVSVGRVTTMTDQVDAAMIPERLIAMLSGFFGALGALLGAIGLYGLLAYTVARRTSEFGIRMALGANARDVLAIVHKSALALAGAGVALGVPLAFAAERAAVTFVDNMSGGVALPIAASAGAAIVIALLAASVPAHRASRISPVDALRAE